MQVHQFERLDINSQLCLAWKKGVHIGYRSEGKYYMSLYRLDNFYVEVHYHTCYDGIARIKTFVCEEQLQPYLDQVDLNGIL
jgi:hypothetical protein